MTRVIVETWDCRTIPYDKLKKEYFNIETLEQLTKIISYFDCKSIECHEHTWNIYVHNNDSNWPIVRV